MIFGLVFFHHAYFKSVKKYKEEYNEQLGFHQPAQKSYQTVVSSDVFLLK